MDIGLKEIKGLSGLNSNFLYTTAYGYKLIDLNVVQVLIGRGLDWSEIKQSFYGENYVAQLENGCINFAPESMFEIANREKLSSYDDYLDAQYAGLEGFRSGLFPCFYEASDFSFKGTVSRRSKRGVCFERLYVSGFYLDGSGFFGSEDHIWVDWNKNSAATSGDAVSFQAVVYRYVSTGNGKKINFGLRNPAEIKHIPAYELPSEEDMRKQFADQIICESCMGREYCCGGVCLFEDKRSSAEGMLEGCR